MYLKKKKPITPSLRSLVLLNNKNLSKKPLLKQKIKGLKTSNGRNNSGKITVRHKGGGHKKNYRLINFHRNKESIGIVCSIEYDPNRNAHISSIFDLISHDFFYILTPDGLNIGEIVKSGENIEPHLGYSLPLYKIPVGSSIHSIALKINKFSQLTRAAGTFSHLENLTEEKAIIKLSSGKKQSIFKECYASLGSVSNDFFFFKQLGKAGRSRWLNIRPNVRGVAMNPVDHPHGGGEGKKSGKGKTLWGKPTKKGKLKNKINKLKFL